MTTRLRITVGEHNLEDENGIPSFFADAVLFTEAIPRRIRARARSAWGRNVAKLRARRRGVRIISHRRDRSLAAALSRNLVDQVLGKEYHRAHKGIPRVTPHRGVLVIKTLVRGRRVAWLVEHRINAAFPPYKRGEGLQRAKLWADHTDLTLRLIEELEVDGWFVVAGGDLNTPRDVFGYEGLLQEISSSLDRLACSREGELDHLQRLDPLGSDHHRILADLTFPKEFAA